tara:strand:- start:125 stop:313 length:189 start_codon:yes stop_codon:yes gene_type:complete
MRYEYVYNDKRNIYYVPRAASLCAARERDVLFEKYLGHSPIIISPTDWDLLLKEFKIKYLEV